MCMYMCVCFVCVCAMWMMDWGHGGLQGCNVVAKTNSCACVWGRCFIATQHIEISQINTPLPLLRIFVCVCVCARARSCFRCGLLIYLITSSIQLIIMCLFSHLYVHVRRFSVRSGDAFTLASLTPSLSLDCIYSYLAINYRMPIVSVVCYGPPTPKSIFLP